MFAESVSIWASVNSWFTPTTFFVLLNLMIGTIYITSTLASPTDAAHGGDGGERRRARPELARSPSVLQRLRSGSFYAARSEEPATVLFADRHRQEVGSDRNDDDVTDGSGESIDLGARLDSDFPQFQNPSGGGDVTVLTQSLQRHGSGESATVFAERRRKSPNSSARVDSDFPQFQNPSGGDDVTVLSQNLQRVGYADGSGKSAVDPRRKPLDSGFSQFPNPSGGDDVTTQSPIQPKPSYADRSGESADRHLDLSARFDSIFPQFQNPRNDDVTPPADSFQPPAVVSPEVAKNLGPSFEEARGHVARSMSDTKPNLGDPAPRLARRMRKSASVKSAFSHFREEPSPAVESRRPATARAAAPPPPEADEGVDAKADDFINRFKQQLKLQRMDSITRYKEMIGRNSIHK